MATVLVVDDVAANRELTAVLLGYRGHEVLQACDGADALALAERRRPDVVVTDVLMPRVDGLEMVHRLRSATAMAASHAQVIFYTANYLEPETRPIAEACGVFRVVLRGADPKELLDAVDEALRAGPVEIDAGSAEEFTRAHAQAVNAKLLEKVRALHRNEQQFEAMAAASPVGIVLLDAGGDAKYVNPRLTEMTGLLTAELLARGWLACLEPSAWAEALEAIREPLATPVEHRYRNRITRADGAERWLRVHLRPLPAAESELTGAIVMVDDITDVVAAEERACQESQRRQDEARQRDAERLDSLRRVAGGMAHDFNNLLGAMLGFLNLAMESIGDGIASDRLDAESAAGILADLDQVANGGERATRLTEQLLAFGRREISEPAVVDVNAFLTGADGALAADAGPQVATDLRLAPGLPPVYIDPRLLDRLLGILVRNASEAMPAGGRITITTTTAARDGQACVAVAVADVGGGMPPEVLDHAFEPFFSTKSGNRTAGLGLATAHGIVTQAGGEISLASTAGAGTTVTILLPAAPQPADAGQPAVHVVPPDPSHAADPDQFTVLLVDDEADLREVVARFIAKHGYRVLTAAGGLEALELAKHHPEPIHCLLTDVIMPDLDGRQLAHRFLSHRPDTKVIFISGYAEALIDDEGRPLEPNRRILSKPFTSSDLRLALAAELTGV